MYSFPPFSQVSKLRLNQIYTTLENKDAWDEVVLQPKPECGTSPFANLLYQTSLHYTSKAFQHCVEGNCTLSPLQSERTTFCLESWHFKVNQIETEVKNIDLFSQ